jgi:hypothetical protein
MLLARMGNFIYNILSVCGSFNFFSEGNKNVQLAQQEKSADNIRSYHNTSYSRNDSDYASSSTRRSDVIRKTYIIVV